jgi:hypothetical protein
MTTGGGWRHLSALERPLGNDERKKNATAASEPGAMYHTLLDSFCGSAHTTRGQSQVISVRSNSLGISFGHQIEGKKAK